MALIEVKEKDILYTECKDYLLTSVVCDYGIYEKYIPNKYDTRKLLNLREIDGYYWELKLILTNRTNAIVILSALDKDTLDHRRNNPI